MPEVTWLTELGVTVVPPLALPLALWTALALLTEAVLRRTAVPAATSLAVRRGALFSLPVALLAPFLGGALAAPVATAVAAGGGAPFQLPELTVGPEIGAPGPAWTAWTSWGLLVVALAGAGAFATVRFGVAIRRLAGLRRASADAPPQTQGIASGLSARAGLAAAPRVGLGPETGAPFTLGARRPLVVVPRGLGGEALRLALAHELAHVRRRDFAWTLAERAVVALCVAHPLVHLVAQGAALDRECLADADVLHAWPHQRRAYADLLLRFATSQPPALAIGVGGLSPLKHRIAAMHHLPSPSTSRWARLVGRSVAAALGVLTLVVGVTGAAPASDAADTLQFVRPTVTLDGATTTFAGLARTNADGVLGLYVEGYGSILLASRPFPGAAKAGVIDGRRASATALGRSLTVEAEEPIVPPGGTLDLYARFDLASPAPTLAPGFRLTLGAAETAGGMARTFRRRADRPAQPELGRADTTMPELIGGLAALQQAVVYPRIQRKAGIEGRSFVQFVVTEEGGVRDVTVPRSSGDPALDSAAVAAVETVRFRPGTFDGRPVAVQFVVPITFRLDEDQAERPAPPGSPTGTRQPEMIGGLQALMDAVVYPDLAKQAGITGRTFIQFTVSKTGAVQDAEVARSSGHDVSGDLSGYEMLDAAALEAVRAMRFRPGTVDGEPAAMRFAAPVRFELGED